MTDQTDHIDRIAALHEEIAQLRHAVTAHAVIDQAMGVVIAYGGMRPETAWEILQDVSQHTNTKMRDIAEHIRQWPHCGWLPDELQDALAAAVRRRAARTSKSGA